MAIDKNTVMREAQKFIAKGQYDKAIAEWRKLLTETPNDANLYNTIGDLCLKKNSKAEAVEAYRKAGDILAADGFTSKAIALYKKTLNIDPKKIEVHLALGDLNAEKGLTGNALECYKTAAEHFTQKKDTAKALSIYQKMADLNPANVAFRIKLGDLYAKEAMNAEAAKAYLDAADVYLSKEAFKEARQLFEKILAVEPNNRTVYYKAGSVYLKEGKFGEACKALKPAFENDPANREVAEAYLDALTKAGKDDDAEQVIESILANEPGRTDLREKLFRIYVGKNDLEKALETASALADARIEAGDHDGAAEVLKKLVVADPTFFPGQLKLAEFYVSAGRVQDAAAVFLQAAERFSDDGDVKRAKTALKRALEIDPDLQEARDLLARLSTPTLTPAPAPLEPEIPGSAAAPAEFGTAAEEPEAEAAESPAPEMMPPLQEPAPAAAEAEDPAVIEAFTEVDVLIKYGMATKAVEQLEGLAQRFPESIQVRVKLRDVYGDLGQMSKAAAHMLVLADLYAKRGMLDQSSEILQSAMGLDPTNAEVLARLGISPASSASAEIAAPERFAFEAAETAEPVLEEIPSPGASPAGLIPELETASPAGEEVPPAFEEAPSFNEPAALGEIIFDDLEAVMPHLEEEPPVAATPTVGEEMPLTEPQPPAEEAQETIGELPTGNEFPVMEPEQLSGEEAPGIIEELSADDELSVTEPGPQPFAEEDQASPGEPSTYEEHPDAFELLSEPAEGEASAPEELFQEPSAELDTSDIWAEAEFYFQQGLFEEAKKYYTKIIELDPDERHAIDRLAEISREEEETKEFTKLAEAVEGLEGTLAAEPAEHELPLSESDEEAVRSLMSEIAQLKMSKKKAGPPSPPKHTEPSQRPASPKKGIPPSSLPKPAPPSRPAPLPAEEEFAGASAAAAKPAVDEDFFDLAAELAAESRAAAPRIQEKQPDDFFDLAAELRDELSTAAAPAPSDGQAQEQSLDEIFAEFKRGIEQQSIREDVDTHYNLGVAYKEMGLLDDAIGEFILTSEDEPKFIQSRYMLGLCYMEKGEYQEAIGELQNAVDYSNALGESAQSRIGMHYDLGLAYQGVGNFDAALSEFRKVSHMDPRYRDTADKLKELKEGDFISLNQLKNEIEREISEKFLEEGERIEREEKNRKNEKIRS
jgi:tetratricopeptide (TPR) repeat protein